MPTAPEFSCRRLALAAAAVTVAFASAARADTAADLKTVRDRVVDAMRRPSAKDDAEKVKTILAALRPDGSFADLNYADTLVNDSWQPVTHLARLDLLTTLFVSPGSAFTDNDELRRAVMSGVAYWLAHDYRNKNWFWNEIGVPERLAQPALVFWNDFTPEQKTKTLAILGRAKLIDVSTNAVWRAQVVARRGLLESDPAVVKSAFDYIAKQIKFAPKQENGPQPDNSFNFHGPLNYTFGYGISFLHDIANDAALVAGTPFAYPADKMKLARDWTLDGAQWFTRYLGADIGANGRGITRKHYDAGVLRQIGENLGKLGVGREQEAKEMAARASGDRTAPPLVGNHQFWRTDMMAHHRPGYFASARLYSKRTKNTEWGNGEALQNFYVADGANMLMRTGLEYYDIAPIWDWQRIPGTTVELIPNFGPVAGREKDVAPDAFVPSRNKIVVGSKETFVGGVSDGNYGLFGGRFSRETLHVSKAWFFFDDEYVCLGSDLACDAGNAVVTTLDQCYLRGDVVAGDAEGAHALPRGPHDLPATTWLLHDGVGYLFAGATHARVSNDDQTGSWGAVSNAYPMDPVTGPVFKAWIDHGERPADGGYAYTVVPNTSADAMQALAKRPPAEVVANTKMLQAVWQPTLERGGAIFYEPGTIQFRPGLTVTVDKPVMLMLAETAAGVSVSVANPENAPLTVHVQIDRDSKAFGPQIVLPNGAAAGSTATIAVTKVND